MSALSILWFLLGALAPQDCGPGQSWQWIPEAHIHACTMPYPATVVTP